MERHFDEALAPPVAVTTYGFRRIDAKSSLRYVTTSNVLVRTVRCT